MKVAIGGYHSGTGDWLVQRATAILLAVALPGLMIPFFSAMPVDFSGWQALFAPLWYRVLIVLTGVALALHTWIGMRDVLIDYVPPIPLRMFLYLFLIVTLSGSVAWLVAIMFGTVSWGHA
ncbi:MAG: succinate dehydrogenase, hydrophobic membrane anchor protein [Thiobacillus sp.]